MGQVSKKHSLLKQVPDGDWQPRSCSPAGLALPGWAPAWAQQLLPYCLASQSALQGHALLNLGALWPHGCAWQPLFSRPDGQNPPARLSTYRPGLRVQTCQSLSLSLLCCVGRDKYGNKKDLSRRGSSGNWIEDRVTWKEELAYKKAMGFL